jgi:plastocyanin
MKKSRMKVAALVLSAGVCLATMAVSEPVAFAKTVTYQVVTNEISAKQTNGSKVEVYRFDPAVYPVTQGDEVVLRIRGVKGHQHDIVLDKYNLKATVNRNETTEMRFRADKPGVYRLICLTHKDEFHEGPMEGYLVVIPSNEHK